MRDDGRIIVQLAVLPESLPGLAEGQWVARVYLRPEGDVYVLKADAVEDANGEAYLRVLFGDDDELPEPTPEVAAKVQQLRDYLGWSSP